jgi:flagellar protein FliO/FliZ
MFETLFGAEMPLAVRFFVAFLIALGLIGAAAWAVRRFGMGRLGGASTEARARAPRLAVVDHASVDGSRQLILVRRDNVEHLLMIGGRTDVVVEANIVRAAPAAREVMLPRLPAAAGPLPRAIPLPESGLWPLQPEPVAPPLRPAPRMKPVPDEPAIATLPPPHTEPTPRPARKSLAALAEEIAARPVSLRNRAGGTARPHPVEPCAPSVQPAAAETAAAAEQSLAELAHRLEAALRKPNAAPSPEQAPAAEAAPTQPSAPPAPERGDA